MYDKIIQLFVRLAVATAFLSAVADRLGFWGPPGSENASWGNWENFLIYSNQLNFYAPELIGEILAILATIFELVFAVLLMIGYKTRLTAIASGGLLLVFALTMTMALGIKPTFTYSVWIGASACFLLATVHNYSYSIDQYFKNH